MWFLSQVQHNHHPPKLQFYDFWEWHQPLFSGLASLWIPNASSGHTSRYNGQSVKTCFVELCSSLIFATDWSFWNSSMSTFHKITIPKIRGEHLVNQCFSMASCHVKPFQLHDDMCCEWDGTRLSLFYMYQLQILHLCCFESGHWQAVLTLKRLNLSPFLSSPQKT